MDWPHAPCHRLDGRGAFIVTCGTLHKKHLFRTTSRLDALSGGLIKYAKKHGWRLQAWAVFSNHYHFVGLSPAEGAENLESFMREFHSRSARWVNHEDGVTGRQVWHNYWETHLTFENSYFARLNYVHSNAVKHGLVTEPKKYPWCSAGWLEKNTPKSFRETLESFKTDRVKVADDFDPVEPEEFDGAQRPE